MSGFENESSLLDCPQPGTEYSGKRSLAHPRSRPATPQPALEHHSPQHSTAQHSAVQLKSAPMMLAQVLPGASTRSACTACTAPPPLSMLARPMGANSSPAEEEPPNS